MRITLFVFSILTFSYLHGQFDYTREWATYIDGRSRLVTATAVDEEQNLIVSYEYGSLYPLGNNRSFRLDKLSHSGDLLWRQTYGADGYNVFIDDVVLDYNQDIIICGWTNSPNNFGTAGVFQESNAGSYDRFLAKLNNTTGEIIWSTYFGGTSNDEDGADDVAWEYNAKIVITPSNEIIWTTNMHSEGMATQGVFQEDRNGANYMMSKFNTSGQRIWSTYYGYDHSIISGLVIDNTGIYVAGRTGYNLNNDMLEPYFDSTQNYTPQPYQSDAYISKFDLNGNRIWSTYFGGDDSEYLLKHSLTQSNDKLYLTGFTESDTGIASEGTHIESLENFISSGFLVEFDKYGNYQWGTYTGNRAIGSYIISVFYDNESLYVTGATQNENMATQGAYQETLQGENDVFIMEFNDEGQLNWGTYYGGESLEGDMFSILSFYDNGFYLTGKTMSSTGIATTGAYQDFYDGNNQIPDNLFIAKFKKGSMGLNELSNCKNKIDIYPTIVKDKITLDIASCTTTKNNLTLHLYNSIGQKIKTVLVSKPKIALDISNLSIGKYYIALDLDNAMVSESFIKK